MTQNEIFAFQDYRDFLNARFLEIKKQKKTISFQNFALAAKRSRAYLKNILSKNRHLSLDSIEDIVRYLKLTPCEREYLVYQYLASQTQESEIRLHFEKALQILKEQLIAERSAQPKTNAIKSDAKAYLFTSLKSAVVAILAKDPSFRKDPDWISHQLVGVMKVDRTEAQKILDQLFQLGILKEEPDGKINVIPDQFHRIHPSEFNFFRSHLETAAKTFDETLSHRPSRFETGVYAFTDENYERALVELKGFIQRLNELANDESDAANASMKRVFLGNTSLVCVANARPPNSENRNLN